MTPEEIVKRLRVVVDETGEPWRLANAAADLIGRQAKALEEAETAIDLYSAYGCPSCYGDCSAANPPMTLCPTRIGVDALSAIRAAIRETPTVDASQFIGGTKE